MKFGLYDTEDNLWVGNDKGPLLYDDEALARVAGMVADRCLHQRLGRTRALPFQGGELKLHDHKPLLATATEALTQLEEGL
jgi:hypothetical protein